MADTNLNFGYIVSGINVWPILFYSPSLNVVISTISKNGSSAIEGWSKNTDFKIISYQDRDKIFALGKYPKFITILRDPIERAISAIHMLTYQHRQLGLNVTWENFTCLEYTNDVHLMPQSALVPIKLGNDVIEKDFLNLWDNLLSNPYPNGWLDVLHEYDLITKLSDDNVFVFAYEGQDVTIYIDKYLGLPYMGSVFGSNLSRKYGKYKPNISEEYKDYLRKVYKYDYDLINTVKFINR